MVPLYSDTGALEQAENTVSLGPSIPQYHSEPYYAEQAPLCDNGVIYYCYDASLFDNEVEYTDEQAIHDSFTRPYRPYFRPESRTEKRVEFSDVLDRRRRSRISVNSRRRSRSRSIIENESDIEFDEDEEVEENEDDYSLDFSGENNENRRESELFRFIRSARSRSPSFNTFKSCKRSQMHRVSLLGRPIHVRHHKQPSPCFKHWQNEVHNFLERPRGWSMLYHIVM